MLLSRAQHDGFLKCLVSGELSLLGMASTGHPPKEGMAAKRMMLAGRWHFPRLQTSVLTSPVTWPFALCVAAVSQMCMQLREEKSSLSGTKIRLENPPSGLLGVTACLDFHTGRFCGAKEETETKDMGNKLLSLESSNNLFFSTAE